MIEKIVKATVERIECLVDMIVVKVIKNFIENFIGKIFELTSK